jgi:hypothetical protein
MTNETGRTTAEELLRMPDDGFRYELVRGRIRGSFPQACRRIAAVWRRTCSG